MTSTQLILLNLEEVRRRSTIVWSAIPESFYKWQPDQKAMPVIEMVRHVLEGEYAYHNIILGRGNKGDNYVSPWEGRPYTNVIDELAFAKLYREKFLDMVRSLSDKDLEEIEIVRASLGQKRKLGDYLLRIAYHESVHMGQMLSYLRTLGIDRPQIWD
ncbi:DinB family protein [Mucilaginibacter sp.]|uniref:DinB family protein n=1 Tax=Mucilaginibacter sp. TaxID=1882438 RepID=UPI002604AEFB|nr:DinB family protein [Mucilaginibacter sp.]MDB5031006.1 DinB family protein [Mucilaginibacter sp.]